MNRLVRDYMLRRLIQDTRTLCTLPDFLHGRRDYGRGIFLMTNLQVHTTTDKTPLQHGTSPG
jgi:hypothetical protein